MQWLMAGEVPHKMLPTDPSKHFRVAQGLNRLVPLTIGFATCVERRITVVVYDEHVGLFRFN